MWLGVYVIKRTQQTPALWSYGWAWPCRSHCFRVTISKYSWFCTRCRVTRTVNTARLNKLQIKLACLQKVPIGNKHFFQHLILFIIMIVIADSFRRCIINTDDAVSLNKPNTDLTNVKIFKQAIPLFSVSSLSRDASCCDFPLPDVIPVQRTQKLRF